ncbi:unnamed protein product [Amoebophrya sp. A25]|nr:unnamed protein product [Amoebophrya sp. A25]|eukprot:GSA25T00014552001.1
MMQKASKVGAFALLFPSQESEGLQRHAAIDEGGGVIDFEDTSARPSSFTQNKEQKKSEKEVKFLADESDTDSEYPRGSHAGDLMPVSVPSTESDADSHGLARENGLVRAVIRDTLEEHSRQQSSASAWTIEDADSLSSAQDLQDHSLQSPDSAKTIEGEADQQRFALGVLQEERRMSAHTFTSREGASQRQRPQPKAIDTTGHSSYQSSTKAVMPPSSDSDKNYSSGPDTFPSDFTGELSSESPA